MGTKEKIAQLLETKFREPPFEDCFIIEILVPSNKHIQIFLDSDSGISFGTCARISRYLEAELDESEHVAIDYKLEVSSPGVKRPLKFPRQYTKHIGRKLKVKTKEGKEIKGKLTEVDDQGISLYYKQRVKEGKKKLNKEFTERISFDEIIKSIVQISF